MAADSPAWRRVIGLRHHSPPHGRLPLPPPAATLVEDLVWSPSGGKLCSSQFKTGTFRP